MTDVVTEAVIRRLLQHTSLAGVEGRVYTGNLATVPNPKYPAITLVRPPGGLVDPQAPCSRWDLYIGHHSDVSVDAAWSLYEATRVLLHDFTGRQDGRTWQLRQTRAPWHRTDTLGKPVYSCTTVFAVTQTS